MSPVDGLDLEVPAVLEIEAGGSYVLAAFAWTAGFLALALAWFSRAEVPTGAR